MHLYYINMANSSDRDTLMKEQLEKKDDIKYKRIEAINGIDGRMVASCCILTNNFLGKIKIDQLQGRRPIIPMDFIKKEIGCLCSHLKAIKTAYDDKLDEVIITEDDVDISILYNVYPRLVSLCKQNLEWDVLQLYSTALEMHKRYVDDITLRNFSIQNRATNTWGSQAYIIRRKGMEKIMKYYDVEANKFNLTLFPVQSHLVSDYFIYTICNTKITSLPLVNTFDPNIINSMLADGDGLNYHADLKEQHRNIKNNTTNIISIINDKF